MIKKARHSRVYNHFNNVDNYLNKDFDIRVRTEIVKEIIGDVNGMDILDLGCGDGSISLQFQHAANSVTLVDISENMLEKASSKIDPKYFHKIKFVNDDILNFKDKQDYDVILSIGLLAHVDPIKKMLWFISDCLKRGGICLFQITDKTKALSRVLKIYNKILDQYTGRFGYDRNEISLNELIEMTAKFGLNLINSQCYSFLLPGFTFLFPNKLLYRYHRYIWKNPLLSKAGSDYIATFRKG